MYPNSTFVKNQTTKKKRKKWNEKIKVFHFIIFLQIYKLKWLKFIAPTCVTMNNPHRKITHLFERMLHRGQSVGRRQSKRRCRKHISLNPSPSIHKHICVFKSLYTRRLSSQALSGEFSKLRNRCRTDNIQISIPSTCVDLCEVTTYTLLAPFVN